MMSQELDRGKPLWEMWVVEGLDDGRFAIITKAHHCMIDGVGSVELTGSVMRPTPDAGPALDEPPPRWLPRPAPSPTELLAGRDGHRAAAPLDAAGAAGARRWPRRARRLPAARDIVAGPRRGARCRRSAGVADAVQRRDRAASPLRLDGRRTSAALKAMRDAATAAR